MVKFNSKFVFGKGNHGQCSPCLRQLGQPLLVVHAPFPCRGQE